MIKTNEIRNGKGVRTMKKGVKQVFVLSVCICMVMCQAVYAQDEAAGGQELAETINQQRESTEQSLENTQDMETGGDAELDEKMQPKELGRQGSSASQGGEKAASVGGVAINEENFPDSTFRGFVKAFDKNKDGSLSEEEINAVTEIQVMSSHISSLKGIEYFTSLTFLTCDWNQLMSLDVSGNEKLTSLQCGGNQLTNLKLNANLEFLNCSDNQLTNLDVSQNTDLEHLYCSFNQLTSLDVSQNKELVELNCGQNRLVSLDVRNCLKLKFLSVSPLSESKVQYLKKPDYFDCEKDSAKITVKTNPSEIQVNRSQITLDTIFKAFHINDPTTGDIEVIVAQKQANNNDTAYLTSCAKQSGDKVLMVCDIVMNLYVDGQDKGMVTDDFGNLILSFCVGEKYAGQKVNVYQLHEGEVILYQGNKVEQDGTVTITVSKLSAFAVALQDAKVTNIENPVSFDNMETDHMIKRSPQTGDSMNIAFWLVSAAFAIAALVLFAAKRQRD